MINVSDNGDVANMLHIKSPEQIEPRNMEAKWRRSRERVILTWILPVRDTFLGPEAGFRLKNKDFLGA